MCWYCARHTTVARRDPPIVSYLGALRREIELVAGHLGRKLFVGHIHFGGGTPTILRPADFLALIDLLRQTFATGASAEMAVEIDPRTLTASMTAALGEAGVTRASLGVQSFDPAVQRAINRIQTFEQTAAAVDGLRRAGIAALNFDLIYGLPTRPSSPVSIP
jgi:oxygen-independent coproporphyrinogen-3 oxidase